MKVNKTIVDGGDDQPIMHNATQPTRGNMQYDNDNTLASDLLVGVPAISEFTGMKPRTLYHLAAKRSIPTFKMGDLVCARKSKLVAFIEAQEAA
ncbi:helix-turn-helix transcriptional regulator [Brucella pituitosa]|uniref:helix-turn-helix transcriptional regulator n=1 Tax=Brucella pituitosa TaxID=571256 RepID=UPI003C788CE1